MKFIMACDESGAKGYATQTERYPGEIGIFAGLLVPEDVLHQTERGLASVIAPHRGARGKLHIAELTTSDQSTLRTGSFRVIRAHQLPCFWYAIHVAGFHAHHLRMVKLLDGAADDARTSSGTVMRGSIRHKPDLLHVELLRALYGHMVAFIEERSPGDVTIEARTDQVDTPIAKSFRAEANRLFETSRSSVVKGFDRRTNEVVEGRIRFETQLPPELQIQTRVNALDLRIVGDEDPIVIAADVLANSLHHHFRSRGPDQLYQALNRPAAVAGHPLALNLDTFWNWGGDDLVGDRLYRHPLARSP